MSHKGKRDMGARDNSREERKKEEVGVLNADKNLKSLENIVLKYWITKPPRMVNIQ